MSKRPNYVFDNETELYHHGIKGQHWGDRRFQYEDGSLTPEGRERYGVGDRVRNFFKIKKSDQQIKADEQKTKAKISYNTQKYKADLKSKAQKEKDARAAEEERNRLKEQAKTEKMLKKEQGKVDRTAQKERNKTEQDGRPLGMKFTRTRKMSDEDLQKAVDRLKLQAEYNKQYVLATQPNGALAKADRFFEGPTGKAVLDLSKAVLPAVATAATNKILDSSLKYHNKLDREKAEAEIEKNKASAERERALARSNDATAESTRSKTERENQEFKAEEERKNWRFDKEKDDAEYNRTKDKYQFISDMKDAELKRRMDASKHNHEVDNADRKAKTEDDIARSNQAITVNKARQDMKYRRMEEEGFDTKDGGITRHHMGKQEAAAGDRALKQIYAQKAYEATDRKTNALNNQAVIAKQIENEQAKANVRNTEAHTESIRVQTGNARASNRAINDQIRANTRYTNAQTDSVRSETASKRASNKPTFRIVPNDSKQASDQPRKSPFVKKQQEEMYKAGARALKNQGYTLEEIANRFNVSIYTIEKLLGR